MTDGGNEEKAIELFSELGVKVVTGQHSLGGYAGDRESTEEYVQQRVQKWVQYVEKLTNTAESQSQAAYTALTKSLQFEWTYLQCVIPDCVTAFAPLSHILYLRGSCQQCWEGVYLNKRRRFSPFQRKWVG